MIILVFKTRIRIRIDKDYPEDKDKSRKLYFFHWQSVAFYQNFLDTKRLTEKESENITENCPRPRFICQQAVELLANYSQFAEDNFQTKRKSSFSEQNKEKSIKKFRIFERPMLERKPWKQKINEI